MRWEDGACRRGLTESDSTRLRVAAWQIGCISIVCAAIQLHGREVVWEPWRTVGCTSLKFHFKVESRFEFLESVI